MFVNNDNVQRPDVIGDSLSISKNVSLYSIINDFNDKYMAFKKDYDKLPKLNFAERIEPIYYEESISKDYEVLKLELINPYINAYQEETIVTFIRLDRQVASTVDNSRDIWSKKLVVKMLGYDKDIVRKYLEVVNKHIDFIEEYIKLRDSNSYLKISGNIFENIDALSIRLKDINIDFKLGNDLEIQDGVLKEIFIDKNNIPIVSDKVKIKR